MTQDMKQSTARNITQKEPSLLCTHSITPNGSLPQAKGEFTLSKPVVYLRQFLLLALMLLMMLVNTAKV